MYQDDVYAFQQSLDTAVRQWKAIPEPSLSVVDKNLMMVHRLHSDTDTHCIRAGRLAVQHLQHVLHLDVPVVVMQYTGSSNECFQVHMFAVPLTSTTNGKHDPNKMYMQSVLFDKDTQVMNPHMMFKTHVPPVTPIMSSVNASHRDIRLQSKGQHKTMMRDLGIESESPVTTFTANPYFIQWASPVGHNHWFVSIYFKTYYKI